jgi:kynurenine 3-monooxygenase
MVLHKIDKNSLHIWPRGNFMLMGLANLDGSFTCTLFMPFEGENSFESFTNDEKLVGRFFCKIFPRYQRSDSRFSAKIFSKILKVIWSIMKCFPWTFNDKIALIGDSAHAIVPFYGHGMNAGFEDITILNEIMQQYGDDWDRIFKEYEISRKPNADAIAELSRRNFEEMSAKTADD